MTTEKFEYTATAGWYVGTTPNVTSMTIDGQTYASGETYTIVTGLAATTEQIAENALVAGSGLTLGKNSYFNLGWLPPDPPPGHGSHRYVFQLFAFDVVPELTSKPGRHAVIEAASGHTIARGMLIGTYTR